MRVAKRTKIRPHKGLGRMEDAADSRGSHHPARFKTAFVLTPAAGAQSRRWATAPARAGCLKGFNASQSGTPE